MKLSKTQLAILALIIANIIWGAASPIFKWSLTNIEPFTLAFLRFFLAAILILPLIYKNLSIKKEDFMNVFLLALFGIGINITFFFLGLKLSDSINAPIIASSGPVFLIIGSILFLHEKPKSKVMIGTLISLLGVILVILRPIIEEGVDGGIIGNLFFVVAMLAGVVHTLLLKRLVASYNPLSLTFWSFLIGSALFVPFVFWEAQTSGILVDLKLPGIVGILFGALLSSAVAYILFTYALKNIVANEVGVFVYIDPIIAVLIAVPLLGEVVTFSFLFGSVLVFLGIFIAEGRIHYHPIHRLKAG